MHEVTFVAPLRAVVCGLAFKGGLNKLWAKLGHSSATADEEIGPNRGLVADSQATAVMTGPFPFIRRRSALYCSPSMEHKYAHSLDSDPLISQHRYDGQN